MLLSRRRGYAASFGEYPADADRVLLPAEARCTKVLEVFLYGGLSMWETLYMVEEYGRPTDPQYPNQQFYTFGGTGGSSVNNALNACSFPGGEPMGLDFATDGNGATVKIGPFAYLLRQRADILARMRLVVQKHKLEPHEAAVPQALTGRPVGQPSAAGLGAHIQRYFAERMEPGRAAPYSYVFATGGIAGDNVSAAASTGQHPGLARPLTIKIDNAEGFTNLLSRSEVGTLDARDRYDQLMSIYVDQYDKRLRWGGAGEPVRSPRFTDLTLAVQSVGSVDAISQVMDASLFVTQPGSMCGDSNDIDLPTMSLNAARHLLTHPDQPARYVCVSDVGLQEASGGGGYDTHTDNSHDTARNFAKLCTALTSIINAEGENDPTKISLDDTLVILNTEFGRTPTRQDGGSGRNHHPYGYATAFIGGPITTDQAGVFGAIGPDGLAGSDYLMPSENRMAALLAMGIWPFAQEAFAVSDVRGDQASENDAAASVLERALGYSL
jgi:hypothetical protein